jgi:flagellar biosynthesis/type III secretory pathway chaperone
MSEEILIEITKKELITLKQFLGVLKEERDAIISFSLEGIIRENNRKEEILKKLEYLETEKEAFFGGVPDKNTLIESDLFKPFRSEIHHVMEEVKVALEKNMKLLSFSMDHVKSSIENIVGFLNKTTYGAKRDKISLLLTKEI